MNKLKTIKNFFIKIFKFQFLGNKGNNFSNLIPTIIPRSEHNISRSNISKHVLKVLYRLKENGYRSYLVGGGVRDLLLNRQPKDFDVATNAYPEKIKKLFKHCYIVGRRFQLAHVHFGSDMVEVATFRREQVHKKNHSKEGMILRDNVYGSIEEDAIRRDFTVNALYYNIADYTLIDYVGGLKDLQAKQLCLIGDPTTRYREDPVRMLRAVRFAAKLGFSIEANTLQPIYLLKTLLLNIAPARLYEEYVKLFFYGHAMESFELLKQYELLDILFPNWQEYQHIKNHKHFNFIINGLKDLDDEIKNHKHINPAWLIAVLLWPIVCKIASKYLVPKKVSEFLAYKQAAEEILSQQNKVINLSKKLIMYVKDIWLLQIKLTKTAGKKGKKADQLGASSKFSAAFQFLSLRAKSGDKKAQKISRWWNKYLATIKTTSLDLENSGSDEEICQ